MGFNALNKAEEFLFQKVLETNNSDIYWDLDETFFKSNHQAGTFIRKYTKEWKYYQKNTLKTKKQRNKETTKQRNKRTKKQNKKTNHRPGLVKSEKAKKNQMPHSDQHRWY